MSIEVGADQKSQWGFLKNIVNIDRFFSSGGSAPPNAGFIQLSVSPTDQTTLDEQSNRIEALMAEVEQLKAAEIALNQTHQAN
jgi:hypothetical protein